MAGRPSDADAPWRRAVAQVLVADLTDPHLGDDDLHHLGRVLRLRSGSEVCATDGAGGWRFATFTGSSALEPTVDVRREPAPPAPVTVAFAPVKGDRPELVVQKLTEVGVDRIVPLVSDRSVVRWDADRAHRQFVRFRRVAVEACAQCRRLWLPTIGLGADDVPVRPSALWSAPDAAGVGIAEPGGRPVTGADRTVLVGPEGGWSPEELGAAGAASVDRVGLGLHVLRAETAAIVAGVLLTSARSAG